MANNGVQGHTGGLAGAMVVAERPGLAKADHTRAFEPGSIDEAVHLAKVLVASRLLPKSIATPEAAFAVIACGRELGLTAMQSLRTIHIIEGKPTLSADLIAALVKSRSDVCSYFRLVESTDQVATYETQRRGEPSPTKLSFTWADAQRAGVTSKDNWKRYPAAMLRARCITALARAVYPDLAMGVYDPDELADVAPVPVVEPKPGYAFSATSAPVDTSEAFAAFCERLDKVETIAQLNAVAKAISAAHKAGELTDANLNALKAAVQNLRRHKAEPPPSDDGPAYEGREPGSDDQ